MNLSKITSQLAHRKLLLPAETKKGHWKVTLFLSANITDFICEYAVKHPRDQSGQTPSAR